MLVPKLLSCLRTYTRKQFFDDATAGVVVGIVALPLAITFAISSGLSPQAGLYSVLVAGFLISALGGSRTQIGGPTGAFVVVVYGIVVQYGVDGLFLCTIMAGVILIVMGLTRLGTSVKYIPRPVVIGFTNGIAVLIASMQIKDFLGLQLESMPVRFFLRMLELVTHLHTISMPTTLLAIVTLLILLLCTSRLKRVPGSVMALLFGTVIAVVLQLPVETIGSRFGGIPSGIPNFVLPHVNLEQVWPLLPSALTIALLGAIITLMSAMIADRESGDKHHPNMELIAQGIGNIVSPLFGGLPATGAVARTVTNIRAGGKTPVAGIVHALTIFVILLYTEPLSYIPLAVLAAILMVVAYNMGQWKEVPKILKMSWASIIVWLATFLLTVFADLSIAVEVGIVLAALLYIRNVTHTTTVAKVTMEDINRGRDHVLQDKVIPDYVTLIRVHGPFLFGATEKLLDVTTNIEDLSPIVILRLRNMTAIDANGLLAFEDLAAKLHNTGRTLIICGARPQPAKFMRQAEFERQIGSDNICPNIRVALARAEQVHGGLVRQSTTLPVS